MDQKGLNLSHIHTYVYKLMNYSTMMKLLSLSLFFFQHFFCLGTAILLTGETSAHSRGHLDSLPAIYRAHTIYIYI